MNSTIAIIGVLVALLVGGGVYVLNKSPESDHMEDNSMMEDERMEDDSMMEEDDAMMKEDQAMEEDSMMEKDNSMMEGEGDVMMKTGSYEAYAPEKLAKAENGDVVLFFRASWCPTCRALDADIHAHEGDIPEGVTILDVDYDNSAELKQKYGVTYQHTLVQVDANGNMITKWSGSPTLVALVGEIQ